jgi:DNA-binding transcriptional LysR family regulator
MAGAFRIEFVAGVTPDKWVRTWTRRRPDEPIEAIAVADDPGLSSLRAGTASMGLVRLPVDRDGIHLIPLYEEVPVAVVAKDHPVAAYDEVAVADLADEVLLQPPEDVPEWLAVASPDALGRSRSMPVMAAREAISVAAAGSGIVILPMSIARLHHRKDVVHRPVTGVAGSTVGLAWRVDDTDPRIEEFIGIVRGRTERSSRGAEQADPPGPERSKADRPREGRGRTLPQRGAAPRRSSRAKGGQRRSQRRGHH